MEHMLEKSLAAIDRNKPWKLYRHITALINLVKLVKLILWHKVVQSTVFIVAVIVSLVSNLPVWQMLLLGFAVFLLLNLSALICAVTVQKISSRRAGRLPQVSNVPTIENNPAKNALNLWITNDHEQDGLFDEDLFLHSLTPWNVIRKGCDVNILLETPRPALTKDDHPPERTGLKYKVPRRFQVIEFNGQTKPIIRWRKSDGEAQFTVLPDHGTWKFTMELRWNGGRIPVVRWISWTENSLPTFCEEPH